MWAYQFAQEGGAVSRLTRTFWTTKLLELAIVRIVEPGGEAYQPSFDQVRLLKAEVSERIREEVMSRWYPLAWADLKALLALPVEVEEATGPLSIGTEALETIPQNGHAETSS